jgi:hypothetical protein
VPSRQTIILSLADAPPEEGAGCGSLCSRSAGASGCGGDDHGRGGACATGPRVPVLACRDALTAAGHEVELVTAASDQEIDAVLARLDGPARPDGLRRPADDGEGPALVLATASDGQVRAVVRRMVRRYAPPPSRRPDDLPEGRTVPDLPPVALLPLHPAVDLADRLGLPRDPADVAKAVLGGRTRAVDLFRNDGGSVTLHGALIGGVTEDGQAAPWTGHVIVDDAVLADGKEPVLACAVANANGYARLDDIQLAPRADAADGLVTVAVAVPLVNRSLLGRTRVRIEVRRATGRATAITPSTGVPYVDDGVTSVLARKRTWWVEPGAWRVFTP